MAVAHYDHWGTLIDSSYVPKNEEPTPYLVDTATSGVVYMCFYNTTPRAIHRITTNSSGTTIEWAYGVWADRATLTTYVPINKYIEATA